MPGLNRNEKITCDNCGTQSTKRNTVRQKTRCSARTFRCTQCRNFSTTSQADLKYHIAKKQTTPRVKFTHKRKFCAIAFSGFYALRKHKTNEHGIQKKSTEIDVNNLLEDNDAHRREKLQACEHFLVDSKLEKGRRRVFNFDMSTFDNSLINKKLDFLIKELKCAIKFNLAFEFVLKNVENASCRCFYAHQNITVMETPKLECTPDDTISLKEKLQKMDIVDLCTPEKANTKWKFYKLTNLTVFAGVIKDERMGCKDSVLPAPLLKNQKMNCLTFGKKYKKALQW